MLSTKLSNLRINHTAGTNLAVAEMLSQDFSTITNKKYQLQHKMLPPHNEWKTKLPPNNTLKQVHEDVSPAQKKIHTTFLLIIVIYQFTL